MASSPAYEAIPSAKRLVTSLRDMGYDFASAVADIVDNSIEARANEVAIDVVFDGDESSVRIADNGRGMPPDRLREAMRYGADGSYDEDSLGKFGLGLKTASMSQCQQLSVASRWNPDRADISGYCWDLDHIQATNRWEVLQLEKDDHGLHVREPLLEGTGTVVVWRRLDRMLGYRHPYGETARKRMSQMCRDLEGHLAMVFHRFLSAEVKGRRLRITLNGNPISPWDPFCRNQAATKKLPAIPIEVLHEGVSGEILMEPFILPHQEDFSSMEEFKAASGPANWNQQQGFYIYRAGRMIQSGGWCRLRTNDEHTKLARIGLSFSPQLDEAFKINVAKMRVQLPSGSRDDIARLVTPITRAARDIYDRRSSKQGAHGSGRSGSKGAEADGGKEDSNTRRSEESGSDEPSFTLSQLSELLKSVAKGYEMHIVDALMDRVRERLQKRGRGK